MNGQEIKELEKINSWAQQNYGAIYKIAQYLNNFPTLINKEIMESIAGGAKNSYERAFGVFLANALCEDENEAQLYEREYFCPGVKMLSKEKYLSDPYYKNVRVPKKKIGKWSLGIQKYEPFEGFIFDEMKKDGYKEIPQIGFFDEELSFPTVFEDGVEWMAIKPNEIETMAPHIEKMTGDVAVFGLGLGYFAYMTARRESVNSVTVIERDESVIKLFSEYILPQLECKDKIKIVKMDAFEYAREEMPKKAYDCAFVDLWHDVSDGVDLYIKMKKLEALNEKTSFSYWIEKSIISHIRWQIFDGIYKKVKADAYNGTLEEIKHYLTDNYIKEFVKFI